MINDRQRLITKQSVDNYVDIVGHFYAWRRGRQLVDVTSAYSHGLDYTIITRTFDDKRHYMIPFKWTKINESMRHVVCVQNDVSNMRHAELWPSWRQCHGSNVHRRTRTLLPWMRHVNIHISYSSIKQKMMTIYKDYLQMSNTRSNVTKREQEFE